MEQEISFNDLLKLHESGFRFISGNSVMTPTPDDGSSDDTFGSLECRGLPDGYLTVDKDSRLSLLMHDGTVTLKARCQYHADFDVTKPASLVEVNGAVARATKTGKMPRFEVSVEYITRATRVAVVEAQSEEHAKAILINNTSAGETVTEYVSDNDLGATGDGVYDEEWPEVIDSKRLSPSPVPSVDAAIAFTKYVDFEGHVHVAVWRGATCLGGAELPTDKKGRLARPVPGAQMPIREKNITAGEAFELLGLTTVEDFEQFLAKCQE